MLARCSSKLCSGLLILFSTLPLPAAIDAAKDIVACWLAGAGAFEPKHVALLKDAGVTSVVLPWPAAETAKPFVEACRASGISALAHLPAGGAPDSVSGSITRARAAGFTGAALDAEGAFADENVLARFAAGVKGFDLLVFLSAEQIHWRVMPAVAVLRYGQWPGMRGGPRSRIVDLDVSSASREPWLDANSYLIAYLRGMFPGRAAWLGYRPDEAAGVTKDRLIPYESVELGLIEAYAAGGNFVLSLPQKYQEALMAGEERALSAWRSLGATVRFLKEHALTFAQPSAARVAVAAGTIEQSGEMLLMMYRRNVCPVVFPAGATPALNPDRFRVVVRPNLPPPEASGLKRALEYAGAGGFLITAPAAKEERPWWLDPAARKLRTDDDRDFYSFRKGHILAYREAIEDPSEFALDVIDALGVRTRDLRLWNAGAVLGLIQHPSPGKLAVELINYGSPRRDEFPVRVEGIYRTATFAEPGAAPRQLELAKRGTGTQISVDRLNRFALLTLE